MRAAGGPEHLEPPGFNDAIEFGVPHIEKISQLLPLLPVLNRTYIDSEDDKEKPRRPYILASWYLDDFGADADDLLTEKTIDSEAMNNVVWDRYRGGFGIDLKKGIVDFGEAVYRVSNETGLIEPAVVYLIAACEVEWVGLNQKVYYGLSRVKAGVTDPEMPMVVHVEDSILKYTAIPGGVETNEAEVNDELGHYLDALEDQLIEQEGGTGTYADLILASPDGAIEQVEWSVDGNGITTRIARFTQLAGYVPSYKDLQRQAKLDRAAERTSGRRGA